MADNLFNASICEGIVTGTCVMLQDDQIVYAGPIKGAPKVQGLMVLLNAADFEKLKTVVDRHKHYRSAFQTQKRRPHGRRFAF